VNILGRRESESEKEDAGGSGKERRKREAGVEVEGVEREGKRRRVAPTLVSAGEEIEADSVGASGLEEADASTPTALTS
jgi:chromatin assembly factor 1 subunit B